MVVSLVCLDEHLQYGDVKPAVGRQSSGRFVEYPAGSSTLSPASGEREYGRWGLGPTVAYHSSSPGRVPSPRSAQMTHQSQYSLI
jgi:hypothetical protein